MDGIDIHDVEAHYEVIEPVGKGGMGTVYRARHKELGRFVAIKVLSKELSRTRVQRERFFREAKTSSKLDHPKIVDVFEIAYYKGLPCFVMEYLEGETFYSQLNRGLSLAAGIERLSQVVEALKYAHAINVTHRDLKPANIMVLPDKTVKVADWGLAKSTSDETGLTKTGLLVGTPTYMAPEQVVGEKTGPYTDLYALGVMLYELCAKKPPFAGSIAEVLTAKLNKRAPSLEELPRALPPGLPALVDEMLERDPLQRPNIEVVSARMAVILKGLTTKSALSNEETMRDISAAVSSVKESQGRGATRPSQSPSRKVSAVAPQRSVVPFIVLAILCTLLGFGLRSFFKEGAKKQKKEFLLPLIRTARLDGLSRVVLSCSRQAMPGQMKYGLKAQGNEDKYLARGDFEFKKGANSRQRQYVIDLPSWVLQPLQLSLSVKEHSESGTLQYEQVFSLTPKAQLDKIFAPIDRLRGEALIRLVKDCQALAAKMMCMREEGVPIKERFTRISKKLQERMEQEGFSEEYCAKLHKFLIELCKKPPLPGSEMARRLLPLRHVERSLMNYLCPKLPWTKCVTKGLGFTYGPNHLPEDFPSWRLLAKESLVTKYPDGGFLWLWICDWEKARQYNLKPALADITWHPVKEVIESMKFLEPNEMSPLPTNLVVAKTIHMKVVRPSGMFWPPKRAKLGFTSRLFGPEAMLSLRVNDSPLILVTNASSYEMKYADTFSATQKSWTCVPLSPQWLREGINTVFLEPLKAPGPQVPTPLSFKDVKIFVQ